MEPKSLLPHSQKPATSPYPDPDQSSPWPQSYFLKIHFNIILPSKPRSSKLLLPSGVSTKIVFTPLLSSIRATCPTHIFLIR